MFLGFTTDKLLNCLLILLVFATYPTPFPVFHKQTTGLIHDSIQAFLIIIIITLS